MARRSNKQCWVFVVDVGPSMRPHLKSVFTALSTFTQSKVRPALARGIVPFP